MHRLHDVKGSDRIMSVRLQQFCDIDECPHAKTGNPAWQESVLMHWYDGKAGIGGLQRIGHEPNRDGGKAVLWSNVFTTEGVRYRRCLSDLPLRPEDQLANGFGALDHKFIFNGNPRWIVRDEGIEVDLNVRNIFPILDVIHDDMGSLSRSFAANHFEAAGEVKGEARIGGKRIAIDGLCYRDHSWGVRDWSAALLTHRWFTGTFGPALSFGLTTWHDADGIMSSFGFVVREGVVTYTQDIDVVVYMEADGITHRGGQITLTLRSEEHTSALQSLMHIS